MKTKNILFIPVAAILLLTSCSGVSSSDREPVDYVNPYIGNISHILVPTYPAVHLPNSMMRVFPVRADFTGNRLDGLPLIVTHHRKTSTLNFMPYTHSVNAPFALPAMSLGYDREKLTPYRYSVYLDEMDVDVDYAPSHQSAVYILTFPPESLPYLIFVNRRGELKTERHVVSGFQTAGRNTKVYFYAETNATPVQTVMTTGDTLVLAYPAGATRLGLRYGVSFISVEQARKNLEREITGYDIEAVASAGRRIWNEALGKIHVEGGTDNEKTVFYTSLYRVYERPVALSEDGRYYSGFDHRIHDDEGRPFYTDDWIWDTYRAAHPLRILIDGKAESDIIRSYVLMAEQSENKWMPTFPGVSGDARGMNSNHGVAMAADACAKGLQGFDLEKAYQACKGSIEERSLIPWSNNVPAGELDEFYKQNGYFPALNPDEPETVHGVHAWEKRQPVAVTLGTSYDHWCLSRLAKALGKDEEAAHFLRCSYNFRNLFNPATGFFHPKNSEGKFIPGIDYRISGGPGARDYYDENNAYIYRWDVQHNIDELIRLTGGNDAFVAALEDMYDTSYGMPRWEFYNTLPDHTGNVGMFSMANEPSLHIPYLYNYAGQPWRTQKRIRNLLEQWFRNDLMGVPGDEDGGGMSAFVVFSQMGFYPVTPGSPTYNIGSPVFSRVRIDLDNDLYFEIEAVNASVANKYIQSATLNGIPWNKPWFGHNDIRNGKLSIIMGDKPNKSWGASEPPPSM